MNTDKIAPTAITGDSAEHASEPQVSAKGAPGPYPIDAATVRVCDLKLGLEVWEYVFDENSSDYYSTDNEANMSETEPRETSFKETAAAAIAARREPIDSMSESESSESSIDLFQVTPTSKTDRLTPTKKKGKKMSKAQRIDAMTEEERREDVMDALQLSPEPAAAKRKNNKAAGLSTEQEQKQLLTQVYGFLGKSYGQNITPKQIERQMDALDPKAKKKDLVIKSEPTDGGIDGTKPARRPNNVIADVQAYRYIKTEGRGRNKKVRVDEDGNAASPQPEEPSTEGPAKAKKAVSGRRNKKIKVSASGTPADSPTPSASTEVRTKQQQADDKHRPARQAKALAAKIATNFDLMEDEKPAKRHGKPGHVGESTEIETVNMPLFNIVELQNTASILEKKSNAIPLTEKAVVWANLWTFSKENGDKIEPYKNKAIVHRITKELTEYCKPKKESTQPKLKKNPTKAELRAAAGMLDRKKPTSPRDDTAQGDEVYSDGADAEDESTQPRKRPVKKEKRAATTDDEEDAGEGADGGQEEDVVDSVEAAEDGMVC